MSFALLWCWCCTDPLMLCFQDDLFPPAATGAAAVSCDDFFSGSTGEVARASLHPEGMVAMSERPPGTCLRACHVDAVCAVVRRAVCARALQKSWRKLRSAQPLRCRQLGGQLLLKQIAPL